MDIKILLLSILCFGGMGTIGSLSAWLLYNRINRTRWVIIDTLSWILLVTLFLAAWEVNRPPLVIIAFIVLFIPINIQLVTQTPRPIALLRMFRRKVYCSTMVRAGSLIYIAMASGFSLWLLLLAITVSFIEIFDE